MAKAKAATKKAESLKDMSTDELRARLTEAQDGFFRLRFRHASSPLKNPMELRTRRREVAQILTFLKQKEGATR